MKTNINLLQIEIKLKINNIPVARSNADVVSYFSLYFRSCNVDNCSVKLLDIYECIEMVFLERALYELYAKTRH